MLLSRAEPVCRPGRAAAVDGLMGRPRERN